MKRRPKIALVVPGLTLGGGVPAVAGFLKNVILSSDRYSLEMVSLTMSSRDPESVCLSRPSSWALSPSASAGYWENQPYLHFGAWAGDLEFQRYRPRNVLSRALAGCDLIQVVAGSPAWANAVCGLGKPVSLQCATLSRIERRCRDAKPRGPMGRWRKLMTHITDKLDRRALGSVEAVQVENYWMFDYVQSTNAGRGADIRYAPPGVDTNHFCPIATRNISSEPYILCVARLDDPRKNIVLLLEAYARLPEQLRATVPLVLAGSARPSRAFWQRAEQLGVKDRVRYFAKPGRHDLISLYQRAAVFVLPSDEEGLGVVVLEAMASGVPVVSTRSGGPDGIISDGTNGYLVPRGDATAMANRIEWLLVDRKLNDEFGRQARTAIVERYSHAVAGAAFLDVWDRLISRDVGAMKCAD